MTEEDLLDEIQKLKQKCNAQLDYIMAYKSEVEAEKSASIIAEKFLYTFRTFFFVIAEALKSHSFYEHQRNTEISKRYSVIENAVLRGFIEEYTSEYSTHNIMKNWAATGLIYQDESGKTIFNHAIEGKTIRSVRVNREAVAMIKDCLLHD